MSSHLIATPTFQEINGKTYLIDRHDHPVVFTTRFQAYSKEQQLRKEGYRVSMDQKGAFYRIVKTDS